MNCLIIAKQDQEDGQWVCAAVTFLGHAMYFPLLQMVARVGEPAHAISVEDGVWVDYDHAIEA